jgi:hypothetical protein
LAPRESHRLDATASREVGQSGSSRLTAPEVGLMNSTGRRAESTCTNPDGGGRRRWALIASVRRFARPNRHPGTRHERQVRDRLGFEQCQVRARAALGGDDLLLP